MGAKPEGCKMKRFCFLKIGSAAYVVAHGRWKIRRGKNPSASITRRDLSLTPVRYYGKDAFTYALSQIEKVRPHQEKIDVAMERISTINFENIFSVAYWMYGTGFAGATNWIDVVVPWERVLDVFSRNGFIPENADTSGYDENAARYARFLIQAGINHLSGDMHSIHDVFVHGYWTKLAELCKQ